MDVDAIHTLIVRGISHIRRYVPHLFDLRTFEQGVSGVVDRQGRCSPKRPKPPCPWNTRIQPPTKVKQPKAADTVKPTETKIADPSVEMNDKDPPQSTENRAHAYALIKAADTTAAEMNDKDPPQSTEYRQRTGHGPAYVLIKAADTTTFSAFSSAHIDSGETAAMRAATAFSSGHIYSRETAAMRVAPAFSSAHTCIYRLSRANNHAG